MHINAFVNIIMERLQIAADPERAQQMAAYMRDQFTFLGVKAPIRKEIVKGVLKEFGRPPIADWDKLAKLCFAKNTPRELQYVLGDILVPLKKKLPESMLPTIETLILTTSWWDTVDWLAPHLAAAIMLDKEDLTREVTERWINSENIWLQRSAIIFQLHYKHKTNETRLFDYILSRSDSKEFFVQKGAGWALRQYSKIAPRQVATFIEQHVLPPLTVREGLKILAKEW
ncbi:DNA alkylation repair protein [Lewinella sp. LCG006]|uniref:DNA alkylation repair protein n=1 Tax=Lewinella sp. LCG006 TaxID=3231911 RepID=UPI0034611995